MELPDLMKSTIYNYSKDQSGLIYEIFQTVSSKEGSIIDLTLEVVDFYLNAIFNERDAYESTPLALVIKLRRMVNEVSGDEFTSSDGLRLDQAINKILGFDYSGFSKEDRVFIIDGIFLAGYYFQCLGLGGR